MKVEQLPMMGIAMRTFLDKLYFSAGVLSAICIVLICLLILARVFGRWMGIVVPSSDDFAGFLLAASSFFGLAYTFRVGGHIRVSLFTSRLSAQGALFFERLVLFCAALLAVYTTYHLLAMMIESYQFDDVTSGYVPVALWLVQAPMALGMAIFAISVIDLLVQSLYSGERIPLSEEEQLAQKDADAPLSDDAALTHRTDNQTRELMNHE